MSLWVAKRLREFGGYITKFKVVKIWPSILAQLAIAKTEAGDENNQDIFALVELGKWISESWSIFHINDPDAYGYSGALCLANQGIMKFVEMLKAPIKVLHPLLTLYAGRQLLNGHRRHCHAAVQRHHSGSTPTNSE